MKDSIRQPWKTCHSSSRWRTINLPIRRLRIANMLRRSRRSRCRFGVKGYSIDGTNLSECLATFRAAIDEARAGKGPQLVVGKLLRLSGHGEHDDASYVPNSVKAGRYGRDCIVVAREQILSEGWATEKFLSELELEAQRSVEESVSQAQGEDTPDPSRDDWKAMATVSLIEGDQ